MKLDFIDVADLMPSIRARGVLVPLLVRPNCSEGHYEVVAGRRRFTAVGAVAREGGAVKPTRRHFRQKTNAANKRKRRI